MLTEGERGMMVMDSAELIRMSGESAEIRRVTVSGTGGFAGPHASNEESVATVPIEFHQLSPEELKQIGADGICSMLPDTDIKEGDMVIYQDSRYIVTDIKHENCFGAVTHLTVKLEREYNGQS